MNELRNRQLYPVWPSLFTGNDSQYQLADYGGAGVTIDSKDGLMLIQNGKNNFHPLAAKTTSLPFMPPSEGMTVGDSAELCELNMSRWKKKLGDFKKIVNKNPHLVTDLKHQMSNMILKKQSRLQLSHGIYDLAKDMPNELIIEDQKSTESIMYKGGSISYQSLSCDDTNGFLLHSSGKNLETMTITPIEKVEAAHSFLLPHNDQKIRREFKMKIYQMETKALFERVFCGVRFANKIELGIVNTDENETITPEFLKTVVENDSITHFDLSPYRPGDYISITSSGEYTSCNMEETGCTTCRTPISIGGGTNGRSNWSLQYSYHPRCFVCCCDTDILLKDLRVGHKTFSLLNSQMGCLNPQEKLCTILKSNHNYFHYIGTTQSLVLLDQRYPGHPVLRWNHQMASSPVFTSCVNYSTKLFESNEAVLLASREAHDIVLFNSGHQDTQRCTSLSYPLLISKPSDFIDDLLLNNIVVDPSIRDRTESPLEGVVCVSTESRGVTVLVSTSAGDVFYQDFFDNSGEKPTEVGYRSGPGYNTNQLHHKVVANASKWADDAFNSMMLNSSKSINKNEQANASEVFKGMVDPKQIAKGCLNCSFCGKSQRTESDVCASCGTKVKFSEKQAEIASKVGVLTGSLPTTNDTDENLPCISVPESMEGVQTSVENLIEKWQTNDGAISATESVDDVSVINGVEDNVTVYPKEMPMSSENDLCNNVNSFNMDGLSQDQDNYLGIASYFLEISHN